MGAFQSRHLRRAPAVGLRAGLLARAVPDKPTTTTTTDAKPTTTNAKPTTTTEGGRAMTAPAEDDAPSAKVLSSMAARLALRGFELHSTARGWEIVGPGRRVRCAFWAHLVGFVQSLERGT